MLNQIVKTHSEAVFHAIARSRIMATLMELCEQNIWNDILHIKTIEIWECILKADLDVREKFEILKESEVVSATLAISKTTTVDYLTHRKQRKGNMAFAIKLANQLVTVRDSASFKELPELATVFTPEWNAFVKGELARSNELNNRALGGRQRSKSDDEEDSSNRLDENMEEIMSRFNIVNNLISSSNDNTDDDDDKHEEEPDTEDSHAEDLKHHHHEIEGGESTDHSEISSIPTHVYEYQRIDVTLPEESQLVENMVDACYWKVDYLGDTIEDLLADYE